MLRTWWISRGFSVKSQNKSFRVGAGPPSDQHSALLALSEIKSESKTNCWNKATKSVNIKAAQASSHFIQLCLGSVCKEEDQCPCSSCVCGWPGPGLESIRPATDSSSAIGTTVILRLSFVFCKMDYKTVQPLLKTIRLLK